MLETGLSIDLGLAFFHRDYIYMTRISRKDEY